MVSLGSMIVFRVASAWACPPPPDPILACVIHLSWSLPACPLPTSLISTTAVYCAVSQGAVLVADEVYSDMRLQFLLLLATFYVIAHAETNTDYSPPPPPPQPAWAPVSPPPPPPPAWTDVSPSPSWTPASPPSPSWTPASPPPPPSQEWTPASPPPPPLQVWTPVSSPPPPPPTSTTSSPPPPPASVAVSPPPPPTAASTPVSPPPPPPPTWTPVKNVNDKSIQQVGQFAVHIYVLTWHIDIVFVNVVSCEIQPSDGGHNYHVLIAVSGTGAKSPQYDVVVWGILGTRNWVLRSFDSTK
ncbi:hypothetical protein ACQ4PT_062399 [Festuca glaucescens]